MLFSSFWPTKQTERKEREYEAEKRVKCDPVTSAGEEEEG